MPCDIQFVSHNIAYDEQHEQICGISSQLSCILPDAPHLLNSWSLYEDMNRRNHWARQLEPTENDPTRASASEVEPTDTESFHSLGLEFCLEARRCHHVQGIAPEHQWRFINKMRAFKTRWNKAFPDKACIKCGTLLLPRNRGQKGTRSDSYIWHDGCIWLPYQDTSCYPV